MQHPDVDFVFIRLSGLNLFMLGRVRGFVHVLTNQKPPVKDASKRCSN